MFAFDSDTAISNQGEGEWSTHLDGKWSINVVPNGGYSTVSMVRAIQEVSEHPDPLSVTTHFYRAAVQDADATVEASILRAGRTATNAKAKLVQEGKERSSTVAVFGTLPEPEADAVMPPPIDLPQPEQCLERDPEAQGFPIPLGNMIEMRLDREMSNAAEARYGAWLRFRDDRPSDLMSLILFADSLPPAVLMTTPKIGWVPTLELTVHLRRKPVPGWIRAEVFTNDVQGKLLVEDVRLWDESDALVAQARQLALLLS